VLQGVGMSMTLQHLDEGIKHRHTFLVEMFTRHGSTHTIVPNKHSSCIRNKQCFLEMNYLALFKSSISFATKVGATGGPIDLNKCRIKCLTEPISSV
jgi:hypothetical protein